MSEPVQRSPRQFLPNPKPSVYTHTHLTLRWLLLFVSAVLVMLSYQSRPTIGGKLSKPTLNKREIDSNRIAVCIAGETRTFYYPGVHTSILQRAIQPLQRQGYQVDVFFVIRIVGDTPSGKYKEKVYKVIKLFNATKVVEYTGYENMRNNFDPDRLTYKPFVAYLSPKDCKGKEKFFVRFSHALYRTQHCLDVIMEHEQKHRFYYHWLYRLRPDIAFLSDDIPTPRALSEGVLYVSPWANYDRGIRARLLELGLNDTAVFIPRYNKDEPWGMGDHFFSASRQVAQVAFNAFETSNDCSFYDKVTMNSEGCLLLHLLKNKMPYAPLPVLWDIVRYGYDRACKTTAQLVFLPNTTSPIRNETCRKFWKENANELPKA